MGFISSSDRVGRRKAFGNRGKSSGNLHSVSKHYFQECSHEIKCKEWWQSIKAAACFGCQLNWYFPLAQCVFVCVLMGSVSCSISYYTLLGSTFQNSVLLSYNLLLAHFWRTSDQAACYPTHDSSHSRLMEMVLCVIIKVLMFDCQIKSHIFFFTCF